MFSSTIQNYLSQHRIGRLATSSHDGAPHIVAVGYVNDSENIYFVTVTQTKKVTNIRRDSRSAFIVDDSGGSVGWRYIIVEGLACEIVDNEEYMKVKELLCVKFPLYNSDEWRIKRDKHSIIKIVPKKVLTANL